MARKELRHENHYEKHFATINAIVILSDFENVFDAWGSIENAFVFHRHIMVAFIISRKDQMDLLSLFKFG